MGTARRVTSHSVRIYGRKCEDPNETRTGQGAARRRVPPYLTIQ